MTIDWKNAPEGATHYSPETDATHAVFYKDDFKQMWIEKWSNLGWQEAHRLSEHERPIPRPTSTGIPVSEQTQTLEAEPSALRAAAIADAAEIEQLRAEIDQLKKACDRRAAHEYKLMGEIDAIKAQNAELLAAQEGNPCKHKFNAMVGGVLSCIHCYESFSEQKEAMRMMNVGMIKQRPHAL